MQRPWFFNPTHVNYLTPHHTVVNRYVIIVTYGTSCRQWSPDDVPRVLQI